MNRRNVIKLLAALLPCAWVSRMLGDEKPAPISPDSDPPPPIVDGFVIRIRELSCRGESIQPCFRATIEDRGFKPPYKYALNSPVFVNKSSRRMALDHLYCNISQVIRKRQFPKDTLVYDTVVTPHGLRTLNARYPDE